MQSNTTKLFLALGLLSLLAHAGAIDWQQVTPKPTNYNFVSSYTFNGTEIFTTGHSAINSGDYTGGILVRNGFNWEYTACYPYPVVTIESLAYIPHLDKILGVGGSTVVTFDPKNISSGCVAVYIPSAYRLRTIATGNGVILALNLDYSILFTSVTGTYWKQIEKLPFIDFHGLLFDNTYNRFMINCPNGTFVSMNGQSWSKLPSNNDTLIFDSVKMYANKLVGVAYDGARVYISDNANNSLHWRDITPTDVTVPFYSLWWTFPLTSESGSSIFVAASEMPDYEQYSTSVWQTDDFGQSWQLIWRRNNSIVPLTILRSRNEWLIGCQRGKLLSTSDWTTFTTIFPSYSLTSKTLYHVSFVNGQFIVSGTNAIYTSLDGYIWNKVADDGFYSITYSPISKLFVGMNGVMYTSPDLKNWTPASIDHYDNPRLYFSAIPLQTKEGYLLVSGQIGDIYYPTGLWLSQDGATWLKLHKQFDSWVCGKWLATLGYANNTVYVSCPGGYSTTISTTNITSDNWSTVNDNYFMLMTGGAESVQDTMTALKFYYTEGSLYQVRNGKWAVTQKFKDPDSTYSFDALPRNLLFVNGRFWALLRSGQAFTSPDGQTWTPETINMYGIRHLAYGNGRYVAVGDYGTILVGKGNKYMDL